MGMWLTRRSCSVPLLSTLRVLARLGVLCLDLFVRAPRPSSHTTTCGVCRLTAGCAGLLRGVQAYCGVCRLTAQDFLPKKYIMTTHNRIRQQLARQQRQRN
eukprot:scpid106107/ scgid19050/ 